MGKKILAAVLIIVLCFGAGYAGAKIAVTDFQLEPVTINAFGKTFQLDLTKAQYAEKLSPTPQITIDYKDIKDDLSIGEIIAEKAMPSVVGITTTYEGVSNYTNLFDDFFNDWGFGWGFGGLGGFGGQQIYEYQGVGTGVIVDAAGYIITNSHVVNDGDYKTIEVSLYDGRNAEGTLLWNDASMDLAIIKIEENNLQAADLGDSDTVKVGAYAAVIGNPLGLQFDWSMSQGIVSGLHRTITAGSEGSSTTNTMENLIQTDATINAGNSGGPLLNSKGEVIGIAVARSAEGEAMGFAIPINAALPIVEQIKEKGVFDRAYLGINGASLETQTNYTAQQLEKSLGTSKGIYVAGVTKDGGAEKAGIKAGDVITKIDGKEVGTMNTLNTVLVSYRIGDKVTVEYLRNKEVRTVQVILTGLNQPQQ